MNEEAHPIEDTETRSKRDIADWNRVAAKYVEKAPELGGRAFLEVADTFWRWLGDVRGKSVLDVGCGHGWLAELVRLRGASVRGIDGSAELLMVAQGRFSGIPFIEHDLTLGLPAEVGRMDLAIAHMVLMDLPEIAPLLRDIGSRLTADGRLIFTIPHPCFFGMKSVQDASTGEWSKRLTSYLSERTWPISSFGGHTHYHRSLSYYSELLEAAGLRLTRLFEPVHRPNSQIIPHAFLHEFPVFLLVEASLAASAQSHAALPGLP